MLISPSLYFPPISFFSYWKCQGDLLMEQHENYQKRSYRNKCKILGPSNILLLSVPLVKGKHSSQNIKDVQIAYHEDWVNQHLRGIKSCYGKSPYFDFYYPGIEDLLRKKTLQLFDLNLSILTYIKKVLYIESEIILTNQYRSQYETHDLDIRNSCGTKPISNPQDSHMYKKYVQIFDSKDGFVPNLSILDLLFCMGPEAGVYL